MDTKEYISRINLDACQRILSAIAPFDPEVTVKTITDLTTRRQKELKKERDTEKAKEEKALIKKYKGNCFRIEFDKDHVCLLHIKDAKISNNYGSELQIIGEEISQYKGELRIKEIGDPEEYFSKTHIHQYIPNKSCEQISRKTYESMRTTIQTIINKL